MVGMTAMTVLLAMSITETPEASLVIYAFCARAAVGNMAIARITAPTAQSDSRANRSRLSRNTRINLDIYWVLRRRAPRHIIAKAVKKSAKVDGSGTTDGAGDEMVTVPEAPSSSKLAASE